MSPVYKIDVSPDQRLLPFPELNQGSGVYGKSLNKRTDGTLLKNLHLTQESNGRVKVWGVMLLCSNFETFFGFERS